MVGAIRVGSIINFRDIQFLVKSIKLHEIEIKITLPYQYKDSIYLEQKIYDYFSFGLSKYEGINHIEMKYGKNMIPNKFLVRFDFSTALNKAIYQLKEMKISFEKVSETSLLFDNEDIKGVDIIHDISVMIFRTGNIISTANLYVSSPIISIKPSYLSKLRHDELFSDLTIYVRESSFKVHKAIMYYSSTFFSVPLSDINVNEIHIEDVSPNLFSLLLDLIYGLEFPIDSEETVDVLLMAVTFDVEVPNWEEIILKLKRHKDKVLELVKLIYPNDRMPDSVRKHLQGL